MLQYTIGIDLGGTNIKAITVDSSGVLLREFTHPTRDGEFQNGIPQFAIEIAQMIEEIEAEQGTAQGVGISAPGLASRDARSIFFIPGKMKGLVDFDWVDYLRRDTPVLILNDAHAALLGEAWVGVAQGREDVVMYTIGTGIGGAIMSEGRLLKGHIGRAGHLGHTSVDASMSQDDWNIPGGLETNISEVFIRRLNHPRYRSTRDLVEGCRAGNEEAVELWTESVRRFAVSVASMINAVDPEVVIIGGGAAQAGPVLMEPLCRFLDAYEMRPDGHQVQIVLASLGANAGAFGVAKAAMDASAV